MVLQRLESTHHELLLFSASLYFEQICFNYLTLDEIVPLARVAYRWRLNDLYKTTFAYVRDQNLLTDRHGISTLIPLVSQPETPKKLGRYFCIGVRHHFDMLHLRLKGESATERSPPIKKTFKPILCNKIIGQKMLSHFVHCIRSHS